VVSYKALSELVDLGVNIKSESSFSQTNIDVLQGTERLKTPGSFVVTTSRDKTIMLWDASSGQHLKTFVSI
jgi:WD40 repeat protein